MFHNLAIMIVRNRMYNLYNINADIISNMLAKVKGKVCIVERGFHGWSYAGEL